MIIISYTSYIGWQQRWWWGIWWSRYITDGGKLGFWSVFSDRDLDGMIMIVMTMMTMMMMVIKTTMLIMSKCLVIWSITRYISTVNCDFQSVLSDRARDKNAAGMQEQLWCVTQQGFGSLCNFRSKAFIKVWNENRDLSILMLSVTAQSRKYCHTVTL